MSNKGKSVVVEATLSMESEITILPLEMTYPIAGETKLFDYVAEIFFLNVFNVPDHSKLGGVQNLY